ncbi:MAG: hypothetical protein JST43_11280 [Bacteroidetes bacterium]|nr:hypothetical protein [Bacteroidota bacterium]MBS1540034.1 hypothetical protein [Bacteroidota bacterium]
MKKIIGLGLICPFIFIFQSSVAQTYADESLIFSRTNPGGSARIQGMGGAQVALGGDYSSAYSNPAGLGFYNRSEITFSLGTNFYNSTSNYLGQSTADSKSNFNIPGFSVVLHTDKNNGKLVSGNFAISFNRINNFNKNFTYQGTNANNSMADYFVQQSDGLAPSQFSAGSANTPSGASYYTLPWLGYENYLIGPMSEIVPNGDSTMYHSNVPSGIAPFQRERVQTSGAQNQWNFAYSVNIADFFFIGGAVGVSTINYQSQKKYTESFGSLANSLNNFELDETLQVNGTGVNASLGIIVKPKDFIQFGASASSPTAYSTITENYSASLTTNWNNYSFTDVTHPLNNRVLNGSLNSQMVYNNPFLYGLTTPWRLRAGATVFIQKHGFITADLEKINYQNSSYSSNSSTPFNFSGDNNTIKLNFRNVFNVRVGGEYRFQKYRVRAGYSYMPDPYSQIQNNVNNAIQGFTGGVGYRTGKYSIDLGYSLTQWHSPYLPYSLYQPSGALASNSPIVNISHSNSSVIVTFGFTL